MIWCWTWALGLGMAFLCSVVGGVEPAAHRVLWQDDCHDPKVWQVTWHCGGKVVPEQAASASRPALARVALPDGRAALVYSCVSKAEADALVATRPHAVAVMVPKASQH